MKNCGNFFTGSRRDVPHHSAEGAEERLSEGWLGEKDETYPRLDGVNRAAE